MAGTDISVSKEIDGFTFSVTKLMGKRTVRMSRRLGAAFGPALAELTGGLGEAIRGKSLGDLDASKAIPAIGAAVSKLFQTVNETELEGIYTELLASTTVSDPAKGTTELLMPKFDAFFQGRLDLFYKVLAFAVEANYGSFFGALGESARPLIARMSQPSAVSPPT